MLKMLEKEMRWDERRRDFGWGGEGGVTMTHTAFPWTAFKVVVSCSCPYTVVRLTRSLQS